MGLGEEVIDLDKTARELASAGACSYLLTDYDKEVLSGFILESIHAIAAQAKREALEEANVCWHCKDLLYPVKPRCERCPDECDDSGCQAPGCTEQGK